MASSRSKLVYFLSAASAVEGLSVLHKIKGKHGGQKTHLKNKVAAHEDSSSATASRSAHEHHIGVGHKKKKHQHQKKSAKKPVDLSITKNRPAVDIDPRLKPLRPPQGDRTADAGVVPGTKGMEGGKVVAHFPHAYHPEAHSHNGILPDSSAPKYTADQEELEYGDPQLSHKHRNGKHNSKHAKHKSQIQRRYTINSKTGLETHEPDQCADIKKEFPTDEEKHTTCCLEHANPLLAHQKTYTVELKNFQNVQYFGDIGIGKGAAGAAFALADQTGTGESVAEGDQDAGMSALQVSSSSKQEPGADSTALASAGGEMAYFPAIYDTGSFEILVLSAECEQCKGPGYNPQDTPLYDSKSSNTFALFATEEENKEAEDAMKACEKEKSGDEVCEYRRVSAQHMFGSGPTQSIRGYENVKMGRDEDSPVLEYFPFWQVVQHQIAAWESGAKFSAIVGLGPRDHVPGMSDTSEHPSEQNNTETLLERGDVNKFSICLSRGNTADQAIAESQQEQQAQNWPPGYLTFNANSDQGETQVEVVGKVHWAVHMTKFGIKHGNDTSTFINFCDNEFSEGAGCAAIIDSGTSLLAAPSAVIDALQQKLQIKEDCSNLDTLPDLEFTFGKGTQFVEQFKLPPSAYVMKIQHSEDTTSVQDWFFGQRKSTQSVACIPAFMPMDKQDARLGNVFIMGMSFLRHYRTTYVRAVGSCPPKMYFDEVDNNCNKVGGSGSGAAGENKSETTGLNSEDTDMALLHSSSEVESRSDQANSAELRLKKIQREVVHIDPKKIRIPNWAKGDAKGIVL